MRRASLPLLLLAAPLAVSAQSASAVPPIVRARAHGDTVWTESPFGTSRSIQRGDTIWVLRTTPTRPPFDVKWVLHGTLATGMINGQETTMPAIFVTQQRQFALRQIAIEANLPAELRQPE